MTKDGPSGGEAAPVGDNSGSGEPAPKSPLYRGEPLDADRGPGLGCFWFQVILLGFFLILTPITVWLHFAPWISATLLILTLVVLLFAGQTVIFLLRLVAADRRTRRVPRSASARRTVGMIEEEGAAAKVTALDESARAHDPDEPAAPASRAEDGRTS